MKIKTGINGSYYKLEIDQKELNELAQGLATSCDRGTFLDPIAQTLYNQLEEFTSR